MDPNPIRSTAIKMHVLLVRGGYLWNITSACNHSKSARAITVGWAC